MKYRAKVLITTLLLIVMFCAPAVSLSTSLAYADTSSGVTLSQYSSDQDLNTDSSNSDSTGGNSSLDTTDRNHDPFIKTNHGEDYGNFLKGGSLNKEGVQDGYRKARTWVKVISFVVGWLLSILFILIVLTNTLGLFYVAIPIGFIRNILSGGLYGKATGMQSNGQVLGGMMGASPNNQMGSTAQGSGLRLFRVVPSSAIQAVELAESGGSTAGQSPMMGGSMGYRGFGGMQSPQMGSMGATNSKAPMVSPIRYYLMKQLWDLIALGFAVVFLILSSVLPDSGIALGNGFVQIIYWALSFLV